MLKMIFPNNKGKAGEVQNNEGKPCGKISQNIS